MRGSAEGSVESRSSIRPSRGCPPLCSVGTDSANSGALTEAAAELELKRATVIMMQIIKRIIFMALRAHRTTIILDSAVQHLREIPG
jgi:hypothetical protein